MIRALLVALLVLAGLAAGCGRDDDKGAAKPPEPTATTETRATTTSPTGIEIQVVASDYGRIVADSRGQAFYLFAKEKSERSECYGDCAKAWPPVLTKGEPRAGKGSHRSLLGTTKRRDGKLQLTYGGQPMYYYESDSPGVVKCQNVNEFGGLWLVVKPNGKPVT